MQNPQKFKYVPIFLLGFGFFGVSVIWGIYNAFVPILLEEKFGLAPFWIGFFAALDNIAALLIQPPIGSWSDKLRTPIGRRMPFILVGAPIAAIAFGFIPIVSVLPLFVLCTSSLLLSMALWRTPVVALMPDITPSKYRSQANAIISFMGGIGGVCAYFGSAALKNRDPAYPFWLGSALVLIATALLFSFVREPKIVDDSEDEAPISMRESLLFLLHERDKSALFMLLSLFCWMVGYSAIEASFTLYARNHLGLSAGSATPLLGLLSLVFIIVALPSGYLASFIGRRATVGSGLLIISALFAIIYILPATTLTRPLFSLPVLGVVPILGVLLMGCGVAWALIIIHALPMVVDMTGQARVGTYTSLYYLFSTLAAIAGPIINGAVVQLNGRDYNTVLLFAPIWMLIAFVFLLFVKRGEIKESPIIDITPQTPVPISS